MIEKIEIDAETLLQPGDRLERHFKSSGPIWLKAAQIALLEKRIEKDPRYEITGWSHDKNNLIFMIRIKQPGPKEPRIQQASISVGAIVIAVSVAAAGLFFWLTITRIYKIIETTPGKVIALGTIATIFLLLLVIFKR